MLFPISQLIEDQGAPLCIERTSLISEALALMIENDFSQLPVIDESGYLIGLFSEESLTQFYFYLNCGNSLLGLQVDQCMTSVPTISPDSDIFEALNILENTYALVVADNNKPEGIITNFDTTHFFRDLSEGLIIVEDIEVTLRQWIELLFETPEKMDAALIRAFGMNKKDPNRDENRPSKEFDELTFSGHIQLITTDANWKKFKTHFGPKEIFISLMSHVGDIRNKIAHFRGELEPIEKNALDRARDWLSAKQFPSSSGVVDLEAQDITLPPLVITAPSMGTVGKYDPLSNFLSQQKQLGISHEKLAFSQIAELLGNNLPDSASKHRSWWSNAPASHVQAKAWINAGWVVEDVDFNKKEVTFKQSQQALYYPFFSDLLKMLKSKRPGLTQIQSANLYNYLTFSSGIPGFKFSWDLPRGARFRVELYIDMGDKQANKAAFDKLTNLKSEIEQEIGVSLDWDRIDDARASRISTSVSFDISEPPEAHDKAKAWGIEMMLKFIDVFRPYLREL